MTHWAEPREPCTGKDYSGGDSEALVGRRRRQEGETATGWGERPKFKLSRKGRGSS